MDELISRQALYDYALNQKDKSVTPNDIMRFPSAMPERISNREWVNFLCRQFDISRTSAKEMLHGMMQMKREDNFKKQFSGRSKKYI